MVTRPLLEQELECSVIQPSCKPSFASVKSFCLEWQVSNYSNPASHSIPSQRVLLVVDNRLRDIKPANRAAEGNRKSETSINGVIRTTGNLIRNLRAQNHTVGVLSADRFFTVPTRYPGLRLSIPLRVSKRIQQFQPDHVLIMTEGPLGLAVRHYCVKHGIPFLTNYTTKWPEYMKQHHGVPEGITNGFLRFFHSPAARILVSTPTLKAELEQMGFENLLVWERGVDCDEYTPLSPAEQQAFLKKQGLGNLPRPLYLYVGRVSTEKNLDVFFKSNLPGTKIVVGPEGSGYSLEKLRRLYPDIVFTGPKDPKNSRERDELAKFYASADVFVFPSKTDTFGLVILEALASGIPVVGFDVNGPRDILPPGCGVGYLANSDADFGNLCRQAWTDQQAAKVTAEHCRSYAMGYSWDAQARKLINHMLACRSVKE